MTEKAHVPEEDVNFEQYLERVFPLLSEASGDKTVIEQLKAAKAILEQKYTVDPKLNPEDTNIKRGSILVLYAQQNNIYPRPISVRDLEMLNIAADSAWPTWQAELPLFIEASQDLGRVPTDIEMLLSRVIKYIPADSDSPEQYKEPFLPPNPTQNEKIELFREDMWDTAMTVHALRNATKQKQPTPQQNYLSYVSAFAEATPLTYQSLIHEAQLVRNARRKRRKERGFFHGHPVQSRRHH